MLLCEAGQDTPDGKVPPEILDSYPGTAYFDPRFHWRTSRSTPRSSRTTGPRSARRCGNTSRRGCWAAARRSTASSPIAARPTDYDEWEAKGAAGWGWKDVLPYFKKVERDMDFDGPFHGKEGRIPVRRIFPTMWNGHAKAVAAAFEAAGFPYIEDQNGEFIPDGYFPITISNLYDRRVSAAIGYLDNGMRTRQNLTISAETQVMALLFEGTKCVGVKALVKGRETEFRGERGHRLLGRDPFAGASAARGDRTGRRAARPRHRGARQSAGRRPAADGPPSVSVSSFIKPESRLNGMTRRHILLALRYSSQIGDAPAGDMFVAGVSKSAWHAVGEQIASLLLAVYKTYSETGQVKLVSEIGAPSRWSSSTCCPTGVTLSG